MYVNVYVYMYLPKCDLYLYLYPYPFLSLPTYLPNYQAFLNPHTINKKKQASSITVSYSSPQSRSRVRVCMCIYELMEGFSSLSCPVRTSPRPSAPLPPKKKRRSLRRLRPSPSPCDGSSHIQSQLDKARQDKLPACLPACLPAKELRKK